MKKLLTLMLALFMLLTLCACGERNADPESPEETYYWRTEAVSRYPFGLDGTISAAAADGEHIFLCGVRDGAPVYTQESAEMERIFIESMQPYLYGDSDMDTALGIARGKLDIFTAEHGA